MTDLTEDSIRERAYHLWKAAGEPRQHMDVFWYRAERELLAERRDAAKSNLPGLAVVADSPETIRSRPIQAGATPSPRAQNAARPARLKHRG